MKTYHLAAATAALALLSCTAIAPAWADRDHGGEWHGGRQDHGERGYRMDHRYHHDRYYPRRGFAVDRLPFGYRAVPFRGVRYFFSGGVWYRPFGPRFVVVTPPLGLAISVLPPFYTTLWVGGVPYYYANDVYYAWSPAEHTYVVTEAPPESQVSTQPPSSQPPSTEQLFIYPEKGQSQQQQATDRYECHHWAVGQTGFDPTQPPGDMSESRLGQKRADYRRAMTACLAARGYSVR